MMSDKAQISFLDDKKHASFMVLRGSMLMDSLLAHGLPVASSCGGEGICSKCRIQILQGQENLSIESKFEKKLRLSNKIADDYRISCQTQVLGDIKIHADYW